jgi:cytidylate kinase
MRPDEHEETGDAAALRARLQHVYRIGGGSGAGKSTIAQRIAAQHGFQVYSTDEVMPDHTSRSRPEDARYLSRFKTMDMDERWVNRSPEIMLETFHWFRGEGFGLIVEDLLRLPADTGVIAEGFRLLPHLVKPLLAEPGHAVWLLPTPEFRRAAFDRRGWEIPYKTSDPELAQRNLLERDRIFTDRLVDETKRRHQDRHRNERGRAGQAGDAGVRPLNRKGRTGRRRCTLRHAHPLIGY